MTSETGERDGGKQFDAGASPLGKCLLGNRGSKPACPVSSVMDVSSSRISLLRCRNVASDLGGPVEE